MSVCGQRILVVGCSGSGKSHVAQELARRLGIPYVCNDAIIWGPDWQPTPRSVRYELFDRATAGPSWTFDGNLGSVKDPEDALILKRADTMVWLDLPRRRVWPQVVWRTVRRVLGREPLWHGNVETFRHSFLSRDSVIWWSIKTYSLRRRQYVALMKDERAAHLTGVRLTSRREIERFLSGVSMAKPEARLDKAAT